MLETNTLSDMLMEIISTLTELKCMHQLNYELLEQLDVACAHFLENHVPMPNEDKVVSLVSKATALLEEINTKMPSDGFLQRKKSYKDLTESFSANKNKTRTTIKNRLQSMGLRRWNIHGEGSHLRNDG